MSLSLFEHNQTAYDSVVQMLNQTGKAAVIHPTGSGKSFIAFKICEQNPDKTVCWLSPSEYIFQTQLENLKADTNGWIPDNICYYTYAKLMSLSEQEILDIQPEVIILDEFHRCGAEMWGKGVKKLLAFYADTPLVGFSATPIRYLDNRRNMADELFDGNVASEMTLGEAIVRGILNSPKYVLSIYSYQAEYFKLKSRINRAKTEATKRIAESYLEDLRRSLEKADGIDTVFEKHITERNGKYIVFCSNRNHLKEMQNKVFEWFGKIDTQPHVYSIYTEGPVTSKTLSSFKNDCSDHLKLLFAIDMLNEGIHVDDVNGVILLRPTVSPIVYKQQIGRALSACKKNTPVIFDVVNNIDSLYSVSSIQEEIKVAVTYYRYLGLYKRIVNESFEIIDETRDAKELFEKLNTTLDSSWDTMYRCAEHYYQEHGDLEVVRNYKTADGYSLGAWIRTQRRVYSGYQTGILGKERIQKLESIGMDWRNKNDRLWEKNFAAAQEYYKAYEHLKVPFTYVTKDGVKLGEWIKRLRILRRNNSNNPFVNPDRVDALDSIGMIWDVPDFTWLQNISECVEYYNEHGDLNVPKDYTTKNGIKLGLWLKNIGSSLRGNNSFYKISNEQLAQLQALGFQWESQHDVAWNQGYSHAKEYFDSFGDLSVSIRYKSPDGYKLGIWISTQKSRYQLGKLNQQRIDKLNDLGVVWKKPDSWEEKFKLVEEYYNEHHELLSMPVNYEVDGIKVLNWINEQKKKYHGKVKGKALTEEQVKKLESVGVFWCKKEEVIWQQQFADVKEYYETYGNLDIPKDYVSKHGKLLLSWIKRQQFAYRHNNLSDERIQLLQSVGLIRQYFTG